MLSNFWTHQGGKRSINQNGIGWHSQHIVKPVFPLERGYWIATCYWKSILLLEDPAGNASPPPRVLNVQLEVLHRNKYNFFTVSTILLSLKWLKKG